MMPWYYEKGVNHEHSVACRKGGRMNIERWSAYFADFDFDVRFYQNRPVSHRTVIRKIQERQERNGRFPVKGAVWLNDRQRLSPNK
jgi:hypothetical protein